MQRILSTELHRHVGERVTVAGWVHRRRLLKAVAFLIVRDAAGFTQVVVADPENRAAVEELSEETVVEVTATVTGNSAARGESAEPLAGYLDGFRWGMPPHGGFAIGLERFVSRITGAGNVREVTAFPRDLHRIAP